MMEQSRHPIEVIARQTGFADHYRMRRAFLRALDSRHRLSDETRVRKWRRDR
jgi:transcriptional regulator GlxA family with amidase domain